MRRRETASRSPFWYKDAVIYQLHVRAFHDSDGNGIGDFRGLTEKLAYFKDLGANTLWLLPFYPSPLKDDGYDIADYTAIHPNYGTMADFTAFLREAHALGLRVVTELVLNHTSDQHPWFQKARRAPKGDPARDFYVWSDTPDRYKEARIIFKDFEPSNWTWDREAKAYFWHRFYAHQPDLNFDNPRVHQALLKCVDFWFGLGVDGLRLDAVPYLYERDGTGCENLPETHAFLRKLRAHVDAKFPNRLLLAEANQWPEDAVAYLGEGNECHMAFHFPIMPRMFMAVHMEDRYPLIDILSQTPAIPENCQWALFLRNHDELTLEMVTDEERDYMYRVYAHDPQARINLGIRRRLAPLLQNNRRKIETLNALLFSLPGTPVIYYGDEIGMGDNIYLGDRNGVRTPMQWSADRNAGFSRANPQKLYLPICIDPEYHYEAVNVEAQQNNPHSLLWWMRRLIALSRRYKPFGRGTLEVLTPENRKVFAFLRRTQDETILVVANLSRFAQYVELDLSRFKGRAPIELFGNSEFPPIGDLPYLLTLGPHAFYWFRIGEPLPIVTSEAPGLPAPLEVPGRWSDVFGRTARPRLEEVLARWLPGRRWFAGKARRMKAIVILDAVPFSEAEHRAFLVGVAVDFAEGDRQTYFLPLGFAPGERAETVVRDTPGAVVCALRPSDGPGGVLYDATVDPAFGRALLDALGRRRTARGKPGAVSFHPSRRFSTLRGPAGSDLPAVPVRTEQSNTSIVFGDRLILKLLRRIEGGVNPDLEIGRFLTDRGFPHTPPVAGHMEYSAEGQAPVLLGILHGFVQNQGNAWDFTLDELGRYYERVRSNPEAAAAEPPPQGPVTRLIEDFPPESFRDVAGPYLEHARLLGIRTADLHAALASGTDDPAFAPEPFTPFYQRSIYQSMRNRANQALPLLRRRLKELPETARADVQKLLSLEDRILQRFEAVSKSKVDALRIRCHGDFHLGQLLYTGKDFVILDFEGEPDRPLSERRIKRSPLRDVAGMIRSFHYAAYAALQQQEAGGDVPAERLPLLEAAARRWHLWVSSAYLKAYLDHCGSCGFIPQAREIRAGLLQAFLLEKGLYEITYELNHRPDWIRVPLRGLLDLLETPPETPR